MSIIDTLIDNRTQADADALQLLFARVRVGTIASMDYARLGCANHKGAYNASDLDRVSRAMEYLVTLLRGYGYAVAGYQPDPEGWRTTDVPAPGRLQRYIDNVAAIRAALAVFPSTPAAPGDMEGLTVQEANAIERILKDVHTLINNAAAAWHFCAELHAGEV